MSTKKPDDGKKQDLKLALTPMTRHDLFDHAGWLTEVYECTPEQPTLSAKWYAIMTERLRRSFP
jgi:hypothetical protein